MIENYCAQGVIGTQTRAETARVENGYESLDPEGTKQAFDELNGLLDKLATTVAQTLDQILPYLVKMQSLLSQRGADRRKVLRQAGLPGWTEWAMAYASKLDRSLRTIQDRIKQFRGPRAGGTADPTGKTESSLNGERVKLDGHQQAALVKAQVAANDLVAALRNGADWKAPLAEYEKVAVAPAKLDAFMNGLCAEPDWKSVLAKFVDTLERCGGELPLPAMDALQGVRKLLHPWPVPQPLPSSDQPCGGSQSAVQAEVLTENALKVQRTEMVVGVVPDAAGRSGGGEPN